MHISDQIQKLVYFLNPWCKFVLRMNTCKKLLTLILPAMVQIVTAQNPYSISVTKDLKTPLTHVFSPDSVKQTWISTEQKLMPLPGGINEKLRKEIDAEREKLERNPNLRSNNKTGNPTKPAALDPDFERGLEGGGGSGTPNDNSVAVGNDGTVINVLNTNVRIYNNAGTPVKFWNLENMLIGNNNKGGIGKLNRVYDPRVMFDPWAKRWMLVFMEGTTDATSFIVVSFSTDEDPTKPWNVYKVPGKPTKDTVWSDYPIVSQTKADLFFTVNLLENGSSWEEGFTEAVIWQIDKEYCYQGDTMHKNLFHNLKYRGVSIWSICPVQNEPIPVDYNDNYFLSVRPYSKSNDTVFLHRIVNTQRSGQAYYELRVLQTPEKYGFPPSALQPGTNNFKLRTNDCRVLTAIRTGERIQYLQNSANFSTLQAHLMHGTIHNPLQNPKITAKLITDDSLEFGYPAIVSTGKNQGDPAALISAVYSSKYHYPGTGCIYMNRYGEYSNFQKLKTGSSIINYTFINPDEQRWGDYEGIQRKYNEDGVFYMVGSYGKTNSMFAYIARVKINDENTKDPIQNIRIFPIPAKEIFVELDLLTGDNVTNWYNITLVDMAGKQAGDAQYLLLQRGINLLKINSEQFATGTYVLQIRKKGETKVIHSQKIVLD